MNARGIQARLKADAKLPVSRRSFFLRPRGRAKGAILLIHGFSACPYELREAGAFLQKCGYAVYAPRLAGHGSGTADFNAHGRADWLAVAEAAFAELRSGHQPLIIVGHSMGGVLAAILAARHPHTIRRLVLAAPAFRLSNPFTALTTLPGVAALIGDLHFKPLHPDASNWTQDYAAHRVSELVQLGREGAEAAEGIRAPLMMLQSKVDPLVSRPFNERLFPSIPAEPKTLWVYDAAEHNVLHHYNPFQKEAFQRIAAFLR